MRAFGQCKVEVMLGCDLPAENCRTGVGCHAAWQNSIKTYQFNFQA